MTTILAGHVLLQDQAAQACAQLQRAGFREDQISTFFVNQPGQHDLVAVGATSGESPGAKETPLAVGEGVAVGGAVGAAVGVAGVVALGPVGPVLGALVGAHVGSLFSLSKMKEAGEPEKGGGNQRMPRLSGMLVAVAVAGAGEEPLAMDVFRTLGIHHLERAEGSIIGGDWVDFDPLSLPVLVA